MADFRTPAPNISPFIQQGGGGGGLGGVAQSAQGLFAMMLNQRSQAKAQQFQRQMTAEQRQYGEELYQRRSADEVETAIQREERSVQRQTAARDEERAYRGQLAQFEVDMTMQLRDLIAEVKSGKDSPIEQGTEQLWTQAPGGEAMDAEGVMTAMLSQRGSIDPKTGKPTEQGKELKLMLTGDTPITYRNDDKEADFIEYAMGVLGPMVGENPELARILLQVVNDGVEEVFGELPTRAEAVKKKWDMVEGIFTRSGSLAQMTVQADPSVIFGHQEVAQGGPSTPVGLLKTTKLTASEGQDFLGLVGNPDQNIQGRLHTENYRVTPKMWTALGLPELGKQGTANAGFDLILGDAEISLDPVFNEEGKVTRLEIVVPPEARVDPSWIEYTEQQINKSADVKAKVLGYWAQNGSGTSETWQKIGELALAPMSGPAAGQPDEMTEIGERKAKRDEDYFDSLLERTRRDK